MTRTVMMGAVGLVAMWTGACDDAEPEVGAQRAAVSATERFVGAAAVVTAIGGPLASRDALVDGWGEDMRARLVTEASCAVLTREDALTASIELDGCTAGRNGIELSGTIGLELELSPLRLLIWLDDVRTPDYAVQGWGAVFARDLERGAFMLEGAVAIERAGDTNWLSLFDVDMSVSEAGIDVAGEGYRESDDDAAHFAMADLGWDAGNCMPSRGAFSYADVAVTFLATTPADGVVSLSVAGTGADAFVTAPCAGR